MERSRLGQLVFAAALAGGALLAALRWRRDRDSPRRGSTPARGSAPGTVRRSGKGRAGQSDSRNGAWRGALPRRIRTGQPAPAEPSGPEPRRVWLVEAGPEWDGTPGETVIRRPDAPEM